MRPETGLTREEIAVLQALQYDFTLTSTPYRDAARAAGMSVEELLETARRLAEVGVLKRVGFYLNYKSEGLKAALIGIATNGRHDIIAERYRNDDNTTHVYVRNHPVYDVWVVVKRPTEQDLIEEARLLEEKYGFKTVVLFGHRTYKLSVKLDLERGVSRSGPYAYPPPETPHITMEELEIARNVRILPLVERPYRLVASQLGLAEDVLVSKVRELVRKGVLLDPGAVLNGRMVGFKSNIMVAFNPEGLENPCECTARSPYTTHVVLRRVYPEGAWKHTCYFMVHGVSRKAAREAGLETLESCGATDWIEIESLKDLKPGVVR